MIFIGHDAETTVLLRVDKVRAICSPTKWAFAAKFPVLVPCLCTQERFISIASNVAISVRVADDTVLIPVWP